MAKTAQPAQAAKPDAKAPTPAPAAADAAKLHRKRRLRPGRAALKAICKVQGCTGLLLPKTSFRRLVREVLAESALPGARMEKDALIGLQQAAEAALANCFNLANAAACDLSKSQTMELKHFRFARAIIFEPHKLSDAGITGGSLLN